MITPGDYRTRDGRTATVTRTKGRTLYPVKGTIMSPTGEPLYRSWTTTGHYLPEGEHADDLITYEHLRDENSRRY